MRIEIPCYCMSQETGEDPSYIKHLRCSNPEIFKGKIFICGCPRSGTVYITEILKVLGYKVGHEHIGEDGTVGYHLTVIKPKNCFHQVRHPLAQIASMDTIDSWNFIHRVIETSDKELRGRMEFWLRWNLMCEDFCVWRYRLEDIPWSEFLERVGHDYVDMPEISTDINSRPHEWLTWGDLYECDEELAKEISNKSVEYGYKLGFYAPEHFYKGCKQFHILSPEDREELNKKLSLVG